MPKSAGQATCMWATGGSAHRLCTTDWVRGALLTFSVAGNVNRAWLPGRASERCTVRLSTLVAAPHSPDPLAATLPLAVELGEAFAPVPVVELLPQAATVAAAATASAAAGTVRKARRDRPPARDVRLRGTSMRLLRFPAMGT